jgi:S1-C subfamily serine protease
MKKIFLLYYLATDVPLIEREWVVAVGNPFNLASTVTGNCKCQSKKYKHTREHGAIESFIQTDAAVNPGNSAEPGNIRGKADRH